MQARGLLVFRGRRNSWPVLLAASLVVSGNAISAVPAFAQAWPARVQAVYKIHFSGLELGNFEFESKVQSNTYALSSNAHVSAMFGAYEWKGQSRSTGAAAANGPKPASYSFNFKNQSKVGSLQMSFADNVVAKVTGVPPSEQKPGTVPLKDTHLKDVLDPLSAVMALTRTSTGRIAGVNPCGRRIPVFDGKQRFDLIFGFKRTAALSELGSSNPARAYVCRVKYVPIAGYRLNEETRHMMQATGIEVWLVPVVDANLFIPYHVIIPTAAGNATLTASRIGIDTARGRIAVSQ